MSKMNAYNEIYDGLSFTAEQKAQIAARAAKEAKAAQRKTRRSFCTLSKIAAAAACLVSVLTITAEAAGIPTPLSSLLAPIFGGTVAQTEVIDKIGHPIDAQDTDNGITIRADAILGDEYNACIVFTISRDDGTALLPENMEAKDLAIGGFGDISFSKMGSSHGYSCYVDQVPGDHEIQYVYAVSSTEPLNTGFCTVTFHNLICAGRDTVSVLEGKWKFRFDVDYEDTAVTLGNGETFRQDDMNFTISEIRVSPIAISVAYDVDAEVHWSHESDGRLPEEDRRQMELFVENVQLILTRKDGSTIDLSKRAGSSVQKDEGVTHCIKSTVFGEVIPLEELESITVGGIVFPIHDAID